jgi:predicted HAD superfamily Cof-like phosphohydrolase
MVMMTYDDDVRDFHKKFKLPVTGEAPPALLSQQEYNFRAKFLDEELFEFKEAHAAGDLEGALDALVDLAWVAIGTAHYMRLPFDAAWREVVRANMEKVLADSDPNKPYRTHFVVKPEGWRPPDIHQVIVNYTVDNFGAYAEGGQP